MFLQVSLDLLVHGYANLCPETLLTFLLAFLDFLKAARVCLGGLFLLVSLDWHELVYGTVDLYQVVLLQLAVQD